MKEQLDVEHEKWLLRARAENQDILLRLFEFGQNNKEVLEHDREKQELFTFLVGTAFSLWRAAFLSRTDRTWEKMYKGANDFLETVINDNAVGYSTDVKTREWMGGYYLNNAQFRLLELRSTFKHLAPDSQNNPALIALDHLNPSGIECNERSTKIWDVLNEALKVIVPWLSLPPEAR